MNAAKTQAEAIIGNVVDQAILHNQVSLLYGIEAVELVGLSHLFVGFQNVVFAEGNRTLNAKGLVPFCQYRSGFSILHGIEAGVSAFAPENALVDAVSVQVKKRVFRHRPQNHAKLLVAVLGKGVVRVQKGLVFRVGFLKLRKHSIHIRQFRLNGKVNMFCQPFDVPVLHIHSRAVAII